MPRPSAPSILGRAACVLVSAGILALRTAFVSKDRLRLENLALRQQLAIYKRERRPVHLTLADRLFFVALRDCMAHWTDCLVVVRPETVVGWAKALTRGYWRLISRHAPGRPRLGLATRKLIRRFALENSWRAPRLVKELQRLGIIVDEETVRRYMPHRPSPDSLQRWMTFIQNHRETLVAMDFLVVPTVRFQWAYVFLVIDHARRRVRHVAVTLQPSAQWVAQCLREVFSPETTFTHIIADSDAIFGSAVRDFVESAGAKLVHTSVRSPWQNGVAERFAGIVRRELLDHVVVHGVVHLERLMREYVAYYNADRPHSANDNDSPLGRPIATGPPGAGPDHLTKLPRVGGLHHRYGWKRAA